MANSYMDEPLYFGEEGKYYYCSSSDAYKEILKVLIDQIKTQNPQKIEFEFNQNNAKCLGTNLIYTPATFYFDGKEFPLEIYIYQRYGRFFLTSITDFT